MPTIPARPQRGLNNYLLPSRSRSLAGGQQMMPAFGLYLLVYTADVHSAKDPCTDPRLYDLSFLFQYTRFRDEKTQKKNMKKGREREIS
jgi:hypothetical protein